jgi:hypothetical protein
MKKQIAVRVSIVFLVSLYAYAIYPNIKIISLLVAIATPLLFLGIIIKKIDEARLKKGNLPSKIIYYSVQFIYIIYLFAVYLMFRVSLFENKLIFNIFETARGKAYVIIAAIVLILYVSYAVIFYIKHARWPKETDFNFIQIKSRDMNQREIRIIISIGLILMLAVFGWLLYLLFAHE